MQVLAPKDGYIIALSVKEGDQVNAGAVIAQMDTTLEDLNLARIAAIDSLRSIFAKRLNSPAIDLARRLSQIAVEVAKIQEAAAASASAKETAAAAIGANAADVGQIFAIDRKANADVAPLQRETAEKNLLMFEYVIAEATSINQLVSTHIQQKETSAAQTLKDSLTLRALNTGKVALNVQLLSYVIKGSPVFEVK